MTQNNDDHKVSDDAVTTSRNLFGAGMFKILQVLAALIFAALIPRTMGAEDYGRFSFLVSIIAIAGSVVTMAVSSTFGRYFPELKESERPEDVNRLFINMFFFKVCFTLFICTVLVFVLDVTLSDRYAMSLIVLVSLIVFFSDLEATLFGALFGHNRIVVYSAREPIRRLLGVGLIFVFYNYYGLFGAVLSSLVLSLCMNAAGVYLNRATFAAAKIDLSFDFFKKYLKFGIVISGAWILSNLWRNGGNILVETITKDLEQVAFFDVAQRIFQIAMSISMILVNSLVPIFSKFIVSGNTEKIRQWSRRLVRYTTMMNIVLLGGFVLVGHDFVALVIGDEYAGVAPIAVVLIASMFPFVLSQTGYVHSMLYERSRVYFVYLAIAVLVFVVLSVFLVPRFSAMGCAIASFVAYTLLSALTARSFSDSMDGCFADMLKVLLTGACAAPILLIPAEGLQSLMLAVAFTGGFVGLLFLFRILNTRELQEIAETLGVRRKNAA